MRICPILMMSYAFIDAITKINIKRHEDLKSFEADKKELLKPFECPALTLGIECNFHAKGEDNQEQREAKPDQCNFASVNFTVNMQPVTPGSLPPGILGGPGFKL